MQNKAIAINLRASNLGRTALILVTLLLGLALGLHPQTWVALGCLPLAAVAWQRWQLDWGQQAPRRLEYQEGSWWLTDAQGEAHRLKPFICWHSFIWIAWVLPWRPLGQRTWLLWPDALSAEDRRLLRIHLKRG